MAVHVRTCILHRQTFVCPAGCNDDHMQLNSEKQRSHWSCLTCVVIARTHLYWVKHRGINHDICYIVLRCCMHWIHFKLYTFWHCCHSYHCWYCLFNVYCCLSVVYQLCYCLLFINCLSIVYYCLWFICCLLFTYCLLIVYLFLLIVYLFIVYYCLSVY